MILKGRPGAECCKPVAFYTADLNPRPYSLIRVDSLNTGNNTRPKTMSPIRISIDGVIEPVAGDLNLSIAKMNIMPDIWPMSISKPLDVPSGAG